MSQGVSGGQILTGMMLTSAERCDWLQGLSIKEKMIYMHALKMGAASYAFLRDKKMTTDGCPGSIIITNRMLNVIERGGMGDFEYHKQKIMELGGVSSEQTSESSAVG